MIIIRFQFILDSKFTVAVPFTIIPPSHLISLLEKLLFEVKPKMLTLLNNVLNRGCWKPLFYVFFNPYI